MRGISGLAPVRSNDAVTRVALLFTCALISIGLLAGCSNDHLSSKHPPIPRHSPKSSLTRSTKPALPKPVGVLVAWARVPSLPVYSAPGMRQPTQSLPNPNNLGAPLVLLVNSVRGEWVQTYLPERPNESLGWIPRSDVSVVRDPERIVVSLSSRHLELFDGEKIVFQAVAAVGSPASPTPTGHFYVTERLKVADPVDSPYGPYALGLSGYSNTYYSFDGGPGQIAIHGTNEPSVIGEYASHGCVRLNNTEIAALVPQVEAGTPVDIIA
jgi:lipoprotein-anchoring transpeptidase ErfK/SrfK